MTNRAYRLTAVPDWANDRSFAFDTPGGRVFFPWSQTIDDGNGIYVTDWIVRKKVAEHGPDGFATFLSRTDTIDVPAKDPTPSRPEGFDASNIITLFDKAAEHLKHPRLTFDGVRLQRAGAKSKNPGAIHITDGGRYGESTYFGTIHRDGRCVLRREATDAVRELVESVNLDPDAAFTSWGKATGNCCCCGRQLTNPTSVERGIGPICEGRWL